MQIKTRVTFAGEWNVEVRTSAASYKEKGLFYTYCFMKNYRGETIRLLSEYSNTNSEAAAKHLLLANKAKEFFFIFDKISK
jgi:hypothetical protein